MANNFGSDYSGGTACAERQPEVHTRLQSLQCTAERLKAHACDLGKRLEQVLGPQEPTAGSEKQSQAGCALAGSIQSSVIVLNDVEDILSSILRRLEI